MALPTITIEVHENAKQGCDARKHYDLHKDALERLFKANGYRIRTKYMDNARRDMLVVVDPSGDRREVYAYELDKLNKLLFNLTDIVVK